MADLRFGSFLAPGLTPFYEAVTEAVGSRLGLSTELVVETSYESCLSDINDVCFVCSLPYVMYERAGFSPSVPIAAPILSGKRYQGRPIYFSDVIVHRDSPVRSFLDLRGRSLAFNEELSQSGYGIVRHHLLGLGETDGFFGSLTRSGYHTESMRMVREGEVEGAAIDSHVLEVWMRDGAGLRDSLRIVDALGPSPVQPVAVTKRLPEALRNDIRRVLLGLGDDPRARPGLEVGMVDRFVAADAGLYDDIRRMVDECEAAGFLELR